MNVLVAALISADQAFVQLLFNKQRFTVLVSDTLLEEFDRVTARSRLRKYFTSVEAARALRRIHGLSEHVDADPPFAKVCRDEKDDYLLALARMGKADLLITGDEDLLVLKNYAKTRVLKPVAFKKEYI